MVGKILAFSGSVRRGSYNNALLALAIARIKDRGGDVTTIDLRDLQLPIYDQDLEEEGYPEGAKLFRKAIYEHQGLLIATPEYNGSVTPLVKNALDWSSRPIDGKPPLEPFDGKPAALLSASMGPFGGLRSLNHMRGILVKMGATVIPQEVAVAVAHEAFVEGELSAEPVLTALDATVEQFLTYLR